MFGSCLVRFVITLIVGCLFGEPALTLRCLE